MTQREIRSAPVTASRLSQAQISQWRDQGYTLVNGLITPALQQQLLDLADATFPAPGSAAADEVTDFGSNGALVFPSPHTIFNEITLDAVLLQAVADLLGTEISQLRITQSDLWPKYGRPERQSERDNRDQRMHVDYPNHSLVHPPRWETPEAVELISVLFGRRRLRRGDGCRATDRPTGSCLSLANHRCTGYWGSEVYQRSSRCRDLSFSSGARGC